MSEGRHQPMRGTQAIEVVDSDDGDDDDDDDDDEIEELPQFDPTGYSNLHLFVCFLKLLVLLVI